MDLRALRYFVATVEAGSITAAAEKCFIAQPSITAAIQKLEEELETKLLIRQKRGVQVTNAGAEFYSQAKSLLQHAASIENRFKRHAERRVLRIAVSHSISFSYLESLLARLKTHVPHLQVKLTRGDEPFNEAIDLRLTMDQRIEADEEFIPCWKDRYCLVIPDQHPLAYEKQLTVSDLNGLPLIQRTFCDRNQEMAAFLGQRDIQIEFVAEVDNEEWALSLVSSGLGGAIVPLPMNFVPTGRFTVRPLGEVEGLHDFERSVGVAIRFNRYGSLFFKELAQNLKHWKPM